MEEDMKNLNFEGELTKENLKIAYFSQVKKFPPEEYEDEFIKINNSYNNLLTYIEDKKIYFSDKVVEILLEINLKQIKSGFIRKFINSTMDIWEVITIENFQLVNDLALQHIIFLSKNNYKDEGKIFISIIQNKFKTIGLVSLAKAYNDLYFSL